MALRIVPVTFRKACEFVAELHRHHDRPRGCKFQIGVRNADGVLCGVAIVGRPISRVFDDGFCAEITRTCTDGTFNANSMLYGASRKAARAMGYTRVITYNEDSESGASLKAAGFWKVKDLAPRKNWAESSVRLRAKRDPNGRGGVARGLWEWRA
jgi:hypothetical protein